MGVVAAVEARSVNWLFDPKIFNYVILALYLVNTVRWSFAGSWGDALYWAAAFQITAAVTWGYQR